MRDDRNHGVCARIPVGAAGGLLGAISERPTGSISNKCVFDVVGCSANREATVGVPSAIFDQKPGGLIDPRSGQHKIDAVGIRGAAELAQPSGYDAGDIVVRKGGARSCHRGLPRKRHGVRNIAGRVAVGSVDGKIGGTAVVAGEVGQDRRASWVEPVPITVPDVINIDCVQDRPAVIIDAVAGGRSSRGGLRGSPPDSIAAAIGPCILLLARAAVICVGRRKQNAAS